jgi:endonuclease G
MFSRFALYDLEFLSGLKSLVKKKSIPKREDEITSLKMRVSRMSESGAGVSRVDIERYLGNNDLLPINYFERGLLAARAVCRLDVAQPLGPSEKGTGFLISPRLLITNHHVIDSATKAADSIAEFDYQLDVTGNLKPIKRFRLEPEKAFVTSPTDELDYTIVAIAEVSEDGLHSTSDLAFLRLNPSLHKIDETEFISIIQHPEGGEKLVAIRENKLIKIGDSSKNPALDNFLWYSSDTAQGSSGSPAFNDQWQVIALHHRGVPEQRMFGNELQFKLRNGKWMNANDIPDYQADEIDFIANEGVRASRIVEDVKNRPEAANLLVKEFLNDVFGSSRIAGFEMRSSIGFRNNPQSGAHSAGAPSMGLESANRPVSIADYRGKKGYDPRFLGPEIQLPNLDKAIEKFGPPAHDLTTGKPVLDYTHFSLSFCISRKLAYFTAVNIDGGKLMPVERHSDKWQFDPRIPREYQVGNEFYANEGPSNYFDRGHLVRRLDPVWGEATEALEANLDTFHWTNCAPQYFQFNQRPQLWQGLEDFILFHTDQEDVRATVFTGPVFREGDETHRGVQIPQFYWKVIVVTDPQGRLYSSGYMMSQEQWAKNIPFEKLPVGPFRHYQVQIRKIEELTGLAFDQRVMESEVYSESADHLLKTPVDIQHPRR